MHFLNMDLFYIFNIRIYGMHISVYLFMVERFEPVNLSMDTALLLPYFLKIQFDILLSVSSEPSFIHFINF